MSRPQLVSDVYPAAWCVDCGDQLRRYSASRNGALGYYRCEHCGRRDKLPRCAREVRDPDASVARLVGADFEAVEEPSPRAADAA